jgi:hypothetical protein
MRVNNQISPIGIDDKNPNFSWNIDTSKENWKQQAYRIMVAASWEALLGGRDLLWDTGFVNSNLMMNINYEGMELQSDSRYYWQVSVRQEGVEDIYTSEVASFETALFNQEEWKGQWIGETEDHIYHIFRKTFQLRKEIAKAKLYVCGLGHYEFYINGSPVGECKLEPGWTNYRKSCIYSTYDVTDMLTEGANAMGSYLGDGMYNVPGGRYVYFKRTFGKCKLLVQLNITYTDGTREAIVTDESWRRVPSPIKFCCIYGGEDYDGRLEQKDFSLPDFNEDSSWEKVVVTAAPEGELVSRSFPPVKVMQTYQPVKIEEIRPGVFLYDLGKNFSGWVRVDIRANGTGAGHAVTMTPGEILNEAKEPDQRVTGRGYHWEYTLNSDELQSYAPRFTYTGFRYVMLEGAIPREYADANAETGRALPVIESLVGEFIYPDIETGGEFSCSNELFNQIHGIITQAMLSNMKSILTDCPHREKLGWLEQSHLIGPGVMYNYEVLNLYRKIERDMRESQREDGLVPDISPEYITFGYHTGYTDSPEWGSACIINPWYLYKCYGDLTTLRDNYDIMKRYVDYLTGKTHHYVLHHGLGDWLDIGPNVPHSQNTPVPVIATAIYYYDLTIMVKAARLIGRREDEAFYSKLAEIVRREYNLQFFDDQTFRYATGSQAAQAMSLVTGLVDKENEQKVLDYLVKDIKVRGYATTAGDVGHPFVIAALIKYGRSDIINAMTNVTDKPGYGYQVKCGATTLTEEWDGPQPDRPHGSQNHYMLGGVEEWFYGGLAGIELFRNDNLFDTIRIKPHFAEDCDYVDAWTRHPYGKVSVHWERKDNGILVNIAIPANTTADFINEIDGTVTKLGSGEYTFRIH